MKHIELKTIAVLALAALMLLPFTACKKQPAPVQPTDAPENTTAPAETQPTEAPTEAPAPTDSPQETAEPTVDKERGDCLLDAETICFIPSGEAEDEVGYEEWDSENVPEGFIVNDDKVYILDSVKHRIILYDNGALSYVPLDTYLHPKYFALTDDGFMVIDNIGETADLLDQKGALIKSIPLPEGTVFTDGLYNRADGIQIKVFKEDPDDIVLYELDEKECVWHELGSVHIDGEESEKATLVYPERIEIKIEGNTYSRGYLASTADFVLLEVGEYVPEFPGKGELTLRKYSLTGEFMGGSVYDLSKIYALPEQFAFVDDNGDVYTMVCMDDGIYITKPNFRIDYYSHLGELKKQAEEMSSELP